ncbi:MAG: hypothetical protein NT178_15420 [Proteobacteria bacterium]|nr:hypothetical protein [Pseudomonadota bacterium]
MKKMSVFIVVLVFFASGAFSADKVSFPGPEYSTDPTGRYSIELQKPFSGDTLHRLFLKNLRTAEKRELQALDQKADVFWAPDGNAVAITDWNGINTTDIAIYFPDRPNGTIHIQEVFARSSNKFKFIRQNQIYFEILEWRNQNNLYFKAWGQRDNNPEAFEKYYECTMNGKIKEIKSPTSK